MHTAAATRSRSHHLDDRDTVISRAGLARAGIRAHYIDAQVAARRWQRIGPAVVLHSGEPTVDQLRQVALINCGPRAVLTSFTAASAWGLRGWDREDIHVLAPVGTTRPPLRGVRLHRTGDWSRADVVPARRLHRLAPALVVAASSFCSSRPGCGLLAAAVQQRLLQPVDLRQSLDAAPRTRHRAALVLAVGDIEQGAQALSEIDLGRLCKRFGLPPPTRQAVRVERSGRRRYLDAEWRLPDGSLVAVEVDGAYHLGPQQWLDDQLRHNEVVIGGTRVLRYPSIVIRDAPALVAAQLRRVLLGRS